MATSGEYLVRPLSRSSEEEFRLVALRMRMTLVEVLGEEVGGAMYSMEWLYARLRWHLDPQQCCGEVLVAAAEGQLLGHTIVRLEHEESEPIGFFSTTYVDPAWRRAGVADALLGAGERWLRERGMTRMVTYTSDRNTKLIKLFEKHGYQIRFLVPEKGMLCLSKTCFS